MAKWEKVHDLKAYLAYRKHKEGRDKYKVCEDLARDYDFKGYISYDSIVMKIENYRYIDTNGKEGLSQYSSQSKKVFDYYKDRSIQNIQIDIQEMEKKIA